MLTYANMNIIRLSCKIVFKTDCCNPNFGLTTKARACEGASQARVTFHAPGSVGECEGMNPHNPK